MSFSYCWIECSTNVPFFCLMVLMSSSVSLLIFSHVTLIDVTGGEEGGLITIGL